MKGMRSRMRSGTEGHHHLRATSPITCPGSRGTGPCAPPRHSRMVRARVEPDAKRACMARSQTIPMYRCIYPGLAEAQRRARPRAGSTDAARARCSSPRARPGRPSNVRDRQDDLAYAATSSYESTPSCASARARSSPAAEPVVELAVDRADAHQQRPNQPFRTELSRREIVFLCVYVRFPGLHLTDGSPFAGEGGHMDTHSIRRFRDAEGRHCALLADIAVRLHASAKADPQPSSSCPRFTTHPERQTIAGIAVQPLHGG
jgi:hypothetical protein